MRLEDQCAPEYFRNILSSQHFEGSVLYLDTAVDVTGRSRASEELAQGHNHCKQVIMGGACKVQV